MRILLSVLTVLLIAVLVIISPVCALGEPSSIYIDSNVYAGEVYVDGEFVGNTPYYYETYLDGEAHRITVSEWGYESYSTTAYAGDSVYAELTKLPSDIGYLSVSSSPSGAEVYIDNINHGTTPMSASFSTGSHSVQVNLNGYSPYYETTYVNPDSTANVYASFYNPNPTPTQSPIPFIAFIAGLGAVALVALRRE